MALDNDTESRISELERRGNLSVTNAAKVRELARRDLLTPEILGQAVAASAQPPEQTAGQAIGRQSLGAVADLAGMGGDVGQMLPKQMPSMSEPGTGWGIVPQAIGYGAGELLRKMPTSQETTADISKATGVPIPDPQNIGEKFVRYGVGAAIGDIPGALKTGATKGVPALLRRLGANQLENAAITTGGEAASQLDVPGGELAGGLGTAALLAAGKGGFKATFGAGWLPWDSRRQVIRDNLAAAEKYTGGQASVATVAPRSRAVSVMQSLQQVPNAHGVIKEAGFKLSDAAQETAQKLTGGNPLKLQQAAGRAILRSIDRRADYVRGEYKRRFEGIRQLLGNQAQPIEWDGVEGYLRKYLKESRSEAEKQFGEAVQQAESQTVREFASNQLYELYDAAGNKGNTYAAMDDLRESVAALLDDKIISEGAKAGFYKGLYGAIVGDLEKGAKQLDPTGRAAKEIRQAKTFWAAERAVLDSSLNKYLKSQPEIERVFRTMFNPTLDKTSQIDNVLAHMTDREKKLTARAWLGFAGTLADDGSMRRDWSIDSFVKTWERSSATSRKKILNADPAWAKDVDGFVKYLQNVSEAGGSMARPRSTGGAGLTAAVLYGTLAAASLGAASGWGVAGEGNEATGAAVGGGSALLLGTAGAAIGANRTARLMMNPTFMRWLSTSSKDTLYALPRHLARLQSMAASSEDPIFNDDVSVFGAILAESAGTTNENMKRDNPKQLRYGNE